ncbi:hypothetical protein BDY21DRAFT_207228 [Lineolata rhizophorae]|uniref:Uncharacterized protein n=1 Tax=Lineolata rhizophorae TaxID=578093 RepID=A0A6A6P3L4_9PEZI|nr:hypothetical protein BDY21DRAFT_207228 [Lineolata rhizophorae]
MPAVELCNSHEQHVLVTPTMTFEAPPSVLYTFLPQVVRTRLPRLPSLRRSVRCSAPSLGSWATGNFLSTDSRPVTPPPNYLTAIANGNGAEDSVTGSVTEVARESDANEQKNENSASVERAVVKGADDDARDRFVRQRKGNVVVPSRGSRAWGDKEQLVRPIEIEGGVSWTSVGQALRLLTSSYRESSADGDQSLARHLFVLSLTKLLKALPENLSLQELSMLRDVLPMELQLPPTAPDGTSTAGLESSRSSRTNSISKAIVRCPTSGAADPDPAQPLSPPTPSIVHRITEVSVVHAILLLSFLLPYIRIAFTHIQRFERSHRLMERCLSGCTDAVEELRRHGVKQGDGGVGDAIAGSIVWLVRGVLGGTCDGFKEGLGVVLGETRECADESVAYRGGVRILGR